MKPKTGALIGTAVAYACMGVNVMFSLHAEATGGVLAHVTLAWTGFLAGLFPFAWVLYDRRERGLPRSRWFNLRLASFPVPAPAIHLWRSRAPGRRMRPLFGLLGAIFGAYALAVAGIIVGAVLLAVLVGSPEV